MHRRCVLLGATLLLAASPGQAEIQRWRVGDQDHPWNLSPVSGRLSWGRGWSVEVVTDDDRDGLIDEDGVELVDNDGDGLFDEDPIDPQLDNDGDGQLNEDGVDHIDNDGDRLVDEDPPEQFDNDLDGRVDEDGSDPQVDNDGDGLFSEDGRHTNGNDDYDLKTDEDPIDGVDNDGDGLIDEGDESLVATTDFWKSDGVDNDGDGLVDEADEDVVRVSSSASLGPTSYALTGWLQRGTASLPVPGGSVNLENPFPVLAFHDGFQINGNDGNVNGTAGPAGPIYGIAIDGDRQQVISQLPSSMSNRVTGLGATPSVGSVSMGSPGFVQSMVDSLGPLATRVFNGGSYSGNLGNWQTGQFEITLSNGDLTVGNGGSGAGILLVNGNLTVNGVWNYMGYVFVTGGAEFRGSPGSPKSLWGALFIGGDDTTRDLYVKGAVRLRYSSETLIAIQAGLGAYSVAAVTEGSEL